MESLLGFGTDAISWLQTNYPQLQGFLDGISQLGSFEFYLLLLTLIYWCLDKQLGAAIGYLLSVTVLIVDIFKQSFRDSRPFWIDPALGLSTEDTYGFLSGHTAQATVLYFTIASWINRSWFWLLSLAIIILMGLSRVYLGVHDPPDVIGGFLLGLIILSCYLVWRRYGQERFDNRILGQRMLIAISVPITLGAIYWLVRLLIPAPSVNVAYEPLAAAAESGVLGESAQGFGALLGLSVGLVLERSRVRFMVGGPIWQRAVRWVLGLVVAGGLWYSLGIVFPDDPLWLAIPLTILRYFLVALWVAYYAPMVFVRLNLAGARPEPEISVSI